MISEDVGWVESWRRTNGEPGCVSGRRWVSKTRPTLQSIKKAAGEVLTAKQALTGPAPPRRSVCAPGTMSHYSIAGQPRKGDSNHVVPISAELPEIRDRSDQIQTSAARCAVQEAGYLQAAARVVGKWNRAQ